MNALVWMLKGRPALSDARGWVAFQAGLFLLPSSAFLGGLFFIVSLVLGSCGRPKPFWADRWNWPFLIAAFLMLLGCFTAYSGWLAFIGLGNWIPFFWAFWAFQPYLLTGVARRRCALWLVAGSVPVVITGLGQLWLGWQGPWELFGGLIVWFMAAGGEPSGRLSGLFDYANIAGAWLALVWPFCLAALLQPGLRRRFRSLVFLLTCLMVIALVLTNSRNAWGGLIFAVPFVLGSASWTWLLPLFALFLLPVVCATLPGIPLDLQNWSREFVPESIWSRLNDMQYSHQRALASTRLSQWGVAIKLFLERPWLGWGAAAFSVLYPLRTGQWHGHAHNLPLELTVSHGFLVALLLVGVILGLLITTLRWGVLSQVAIKQNGASIAFFDRAWWTATFILVLLHGADMPFFDSRINLVGWILLAGLRCMILEYQMFQNSQIELVDDVQSIAHV